MTSLGVEAFAISVILSEATNLGLFFDEPWKLKIRDVSSLNVNIRALLGSDEKSPHEEGPNE